MAENGNGFNGAAVLGPRRACRRVIDGGERKRLQWGRGLGTAESGDARGHSFASPLASMGPRSWDRGEVVACVKAPLMRTGLQWGRGLGTAERRWLIAPQTADGQASMGPRSWDRGEE